MNIETIKLRKCPICEKEIIIRNICGVYYTYCESCGMRSGDYKTKQNLLKSIDIDIKKIMTILN